MKWIFRKIIAFFSVYYAYVMEYRAEIFLWALSGSLPLILMGLWIEASKSGNFSLTSTQFAQYFLTVFLVKEFTIVWMIWEFEREVLEGILSFRLLQPIDPVWHHVAMHLSERVARIPFTVGLVCLFFVLYPDALWLPKFTNILLFVIVVALAFTLRFIIQYTFAIFAFWTERVASIEELWYLIYLFCGWGNCPFRGFSPFNAKNIIMDSFSLLGAFSYGYFNWFTCGYS
jgi:ABC-2 type transport system permease protein